MHGIRLQTVCALAIVVLLSACVTPPPPPPSTVVTREVAQGEWVFGQAVWYGELFHGRRTTSGDKFDMRELTGAHTTIPLGARVEVTTPGTNKSVIIVINDRSHLEGGVDLALSKAVAQKLGMVNQRRFEVSYQWLE